MLVAGGRRVIFYACVVLMLVALHTCHTCQVEGIRVLPGNAVPDVEFSHGSVNDNNKRKEDLFNKYFNGRTHLARTNTTQKGFDEAKRRVPSCPDPLHN
ncbi:hypothetical protein DEO72_LG9g3653 [Vigna unguiculata]|uniref:Uncharacterized protein n=1 Tax=Vigna unguiculata TaxID=3917 RepID=A0A4D6N702_VIGUN|nr:hypothetical protein DEO72_LG9g3653 [Vigna unguiculata]